MLYSASNRPITIIVGLGLPRQISDTHEALTFLDECPVALRDDGYVSTVALCRKAMTDNAQERAAMQAFASFANRRGFLLADIFAPASAGNESAAV